MYGFKHLLNNSHFDFKHNRTNKSDRYLTGGIIIVFLLYPFSGGNLNCNYGLPYHVFRKNKTLW